MQYRWTFRTRKAALAFLVKKLGRAGLTLWRPGTSGNPFKSRWVVEYAS